MMVRGRVRVALLALFLATLVSCADTKNWVTTRIHDEPPAPAESTLPSSRPAVDRARRHMQAGDYQMAIDVYNAAYQKMPRDRALQSAYLQGVEGMADTADQALDRQDFGAAGKIYDILRKNYTRFKGFESQLAFTPARLDEKLERCKKALFRQGFQEYREGNLERAIVLWQDLLVIDPQNADIQEALRIAKRQHKNLQETE